MDSIAKHYLPSVTDANGDDLRTGDRVHVTGSSRFGEFDGTVIGAIVTGTQVIDYRVQGGELVADADSTVRVRVLRDGSDDEDYTASRGRVTLITDKAVGDEATKEAAIA